MVTFIDNAMKWDESVLVSGNKASGDLDRVGATEALAVQRVGDHDVDGKIVVLFQGPPSVYSVRLSRQGAAHDLELLRHSAASGANFGSPDLLVGLDIRAKEVVAVQPLPRPARK